MAMKEQQQFNELVMMYLAEEHEVKFTLLLSEVFYSVTLIHSFDDSFCLNVQKEMEKIHRKMHNLERELDTKQGLESEVEQLRVTFQAMNHRRESEWSQSKWMCKKRKRN
jgi:hypothetical protein